MTVSAPAAAPDEFIDEGSGTRRNRMTHAVKKSTLRVVVIDNRAFMLA